MNVADARVSNQSRVERERDKCLNGFDERMRLATLVTRTVQPRHTQSVNDGVRVALVDCMGHLEDEGESRFRLKLLVEVTGTVNDIEKRVT